MSPPGKKGRRWKERHREGQFQRPRNRDGGKEDEKIKTSFIGSISSGRGRWEKRGPCLPQGHSEGRVDV